MGYILRHVMGGCDSNPPDAIITDNRSFVNIIFKKIELGDDNTRLYRRGEALAVQAQVHVLTHVPCGFRPLGAVREQLEFVELGAGELHQDAARAV
jgi:hypothetical protein